MKMIKLIPGYLLCTGPGWCGLMLLEDAGLEVVVNSVDNGLSTYIHTWPCWVVNCCHDEGRTKRV